MEGDSGSNNNSAENSGAEFEKNALRFPRIDFRPIRAGVSYCAEHPFAAGVFSILGLIGLFFSYFAFTVDRQEAKETSRQIETESQIIREKINEANETLQRVDAKVETKNRAEKSTYQSGTFLYEEPVEGVYSNFWTAYLLRSDPSPELTIRGEGKTINFSGVIQLNCENGKYFWSTSSNFDKSLKREQVDQIVPEPAVRAAKRIFCWDKNFAPF